ncbi:lactate dehydrogenase-like 2-hydroxyacid dehydrogenase [Anaerosolibacter carboniphilus]|uniref:Lactate dehydrogenase-like 2-hydroxyacid dehydrogenase n=1 Tax=Anaerosolibacter carboniphilus TaxID=1417629 RepID=A0A841KXN5_9FIRM|nr:D-glycerate dehydrogenase [Anaerosolibacter carboniphilus]MBB6215692.1 lactate dehydrogenase-like 2-hydroxyacid dehydrogenase [Anaerosolibacter carboniphilus]
MSKPKVLVTRKIPEEAIQLLEQYCDVEINPHDREMTRKELLESVRNKDGVLCLLTNTIDEEVFEAAGKQCKIFSNYAVGYNNIDVEGASRRGIAITNTPGVLDDATADLAWALLFAVARRIPEGDQYIRDGRFTAWSPTLLLGRDITGKTLGIIGAGRIGSNFGRKAKAFDMKILYTGTKPNHSFEAETGATFTDKETLLKASDFISIHVPLSPATKYYIGDREFDMMKNTAILINTSRGPVINEKALVQALKEKKIWGAGLDVFENEPELTPGLTQLDNVVIVPHIGSATVESRLKMGIMAVQNIIQALQGEIPDHCINPAVYEHKLKK